MDPRASMRWFQSIRTSFAIVICVGSAIASIATPVVAEGEIWSIPIVRWQPNEVAQPNAQSTGAKNVTPGAAVTSLPSLEEKLIDGTVEFVVTRAKAEAALFFQEQLYEELCANDKNADYLLHTCIALQSVQRAMSLNAMGLYLRSSVKKDLERIPQVYFHRAINSCADGCPTLQVAELVIPAYRAAREGRDPIDILRGMSGFTEDYCGNDGSQQRKGVCAIAQGAAYLISVEQKLFDKGKLVPEVSAKMATTLKVEFRFLQRAHQIIGRIQRIVSEISHPVQLADGRMSYDPRLRLDERLIAMDEMLNLLDQLVQMNKQSTTQDQDAVAAFRRAAVFAKELLRGDEAAYVNELVAYVAETVTDKDNRMPDALMRFMPLAVEISNAQSSKDVANAIEAAAAPVGSYRLKSKRDLTSITAFFGTGYTRKVYELDGRDEKSYRWWDVVAPIGIHMSYALCDKRSWFKYYGWYISLLDFGPLVNTRNESGIESQPNTTIKQIFSPGLFATVHLYGPALLGVGASRTPELVRTETSEDISAWRFQAFVAMDLTLFPF